MATFKELDESIINYFQEMEKNFELAVDIRFCFLANNKQKQLVKIMRVPDNYSVLTKADLLVIFNEEYFNLFEKEEQGHQNKTILIEQEIDKIEFNYEKGTVKVKRPRINTSVGLIKKYSLEAISDAIRLQEEFESQKRDKKEEEKAQKANKYGRKNNNFNRGK
jgi:hypothetical protein